MPVVLERSYSFSASHLYRRPDWSEERNNERFGRCAIAPAHGHNYRLTVRVAGTIDVETGFAIDLPLLDRLVRSTVVDRLDHRHINEAIEEFGPGRKIPTTENLVEWIGAEIRTRLSPGNRLMEIRLAEDDRLASIWTPDC